MEELAGTKKFVMMSTDRDETEHSMEMHLPYIYKMISQHFKSEAQHPPLIPILVGGTDSKAEKSYGEILAPYLADPTSVFVVSSDFCHWGLRFQYTYYLPDTAATSTGGINLKRRDNAPTKPPIYQSIARLDRMAFDAIEGGKHEDFLEIIDKTENTVCGRHPIGVVMAAIEKLKEQGKLKEGEGRFKFVQYERNEDVEDVSDSSVSYASAFAIFQ